jgi:mono/diheme cytochrome c family protein
MIRLSILGLIVAVGLTVTFFAITFFDQNLKVGRMWETKAVRPHETPILVMEKNAVPFEKSELLYRMTASTKLNSPMNLKDSQIIAKGEQVYVNFCIHCHGIYHDGNGTVGQSFVPLPEDLRGIRVQNKLSPAKLFHEISYGIPGGRQPPLATTVSVTDRWRVIAYVKSLGQRE